MYAPPVAAPSRCELARVAAEVCAAINVALRFVSVDQVAALVPLDVVLADPASPLDIEVTDVGWAVTV